MPSTLTARFDAASMAQKHSLTLKYLKVPNMDIKSFKGTFMLKALYFVATLVVGV